MKLIIFVQLFYRDYERSRDFRGGGGGGGEPVSLPSASGTSAGWLAYSWFSAALPVLSITVIESVFCGVPRLPQPRGSVRPRVPVRGRLPGVDAAKAACWSTRDREARAPFRVDTRQWQCGDTVSNKSLDFYALLCAHCNCSPVPVTSVIKLLIYVHNLLFVFVCKKVAKLISIWLKKIWTFSHIG